MPIKNLSDIRRLPRLGKIALGIKKISDKSGKEYPSETDYFVCPPKVQEVFGEKPKELRIMFPIEDADVFFQQWYKSYGYNLLKCKGNGDRANAWDEEHGGMKEIPCPCEKLEAGDCKKVGILQFLLPDVPGAGVWQVTTSSRDSIIDINSAVDTIRAICGRIRMIPLILKRAENVKQRLEDGKPKKSTHYTLQIDVENITIRQLQEAAQVAPEKVLLPPPDESKDELFYPKNGFKPEEETVDGEIVDDQTMKAKEQLDGLMEEYVKLGGEIGPETTEKMRKFTKFEQYSKEIDRLQVAIEKKKEKPKSKSDKPDNLFGPEETKRG